jgi:hypothetical protein
MAWRCDLSVLVGRVNFSKHQESVIKGRKATKALQGLGVLEFFPNIPQPTFTSNQQLQFTKAIKAKHPHFNQR